MTAEKNIKLFKIASDINIGKDAIVDFLQAKGFDIENKPTSNLTPEMVDIIYDKFKKEKIAVDKQRLKLEKHKQIRVPKREKPEEAKIAVPEKQITKDKPEISVKQPPEIQEIVDIHQIEEPTKTVTESYLKQEYQTKVQETEHVEAVTPGEKQPERVIIDLDKFQFDKRTKKDKKQPEPERQFKKEPPRQDQKKKFGQYERQHPDKRDGSNRQRTDSKVELPSEIILPPVSDEKPVRIEIPEIEPVVTTVQPTEIAITTPLIDEVKSAPVSEEDQAKKHHKKKKKRRKVAEVEFDGEDDSPKLKGLTIVGKIDLKLDKDSKFKKDKKVKKKIKFGEEPEPEATVEHKTKKVKKKKGKFGEEPEPVTVDRGKGDRFKKKKKNVREMITTEDVDAAIRKTMSDMELSSVSSQRSKLRQRKRAEREVKELRKQEEIDKESKILKLTEFVTTSDLAGLMEVSANEIILKCMELGLMVSINQRLDKDTITLISDDYGYEVEFMDEQSIQIVDDEEDDPALLVPRPPIVTIMGHVDHGKTSLLDYIRHANVVAGEAGGITQHIGAYQVELPNGKYITFLDTPGHEAFTAMRARGAQVTDIVVLVVAADDSVMPQTIEAISHAQAANVPIIVAINKIDKPDANPDRIKQQLTDHGILVEDWGGNYQSIELSAKKGINVDVLLEKILLEAELLDLKANPDRLARAAVVEANMDKGFGAVSTVIVQKGTIKVGSAFVSGVFSGKVRAMFDERGNKVEEAGPADPVRVIGFDGLPQAGDILTVVQNEVEARIIATQRAQRKREQEFRMVRHVTLDDISKQIRVGGVKELYLIIKGDVSGSVEALSDSLQKLSTDEVRVVILHKGVGSINESDVMLAAASGAVVIGFQVSPTTKARKVGETEAVDIRLYNIIYDCINEVRLALEGLLTPDTKEDVTATVEIRAVFRISKTGSIAGCYVTDGKITRNDRVRILRDGLPIYNGTIQSLKRNKDDVREVDSGYECGIFFDGFSDFEAGDIVESYKLVEVKRTIS